MSHESMSQIRKNKSFGRNNKIKHYFFLFSLLPLSGVLSGADIQKSRSSGIPVQCRSYDVRMTSETVFTVKPSQAYPPRFYQ